MYMAAPINTGLKIKEAETDLQVSTKPLPKRTGIALLDLDLAKKQLNGVDTPRFTPTAAESPNRFIVTTPRDPRDLSPTALSNQIHRIDSTTTSPRLGVIQKSKSMLSKSLKINAEPSSSSITHSTSVPYLALQSKNGFDIRGFFKRAVEAKLEVRINEIGAVAQNLISQTDPDVTLDVDKNGNLVVSTIIQRLYNLDQILHVIIHDLELAVRVQYNHTPLHTLIIQLKKGIEEKISEEECSNKEEIVGRFNAMLFKLDFERKKKDPSSLKSSTTELLGPYFSRHKKVRKADKFQLQTLLSMHKRNESNETIDGTISIENFLNSYPLLQVTSEVLFKNIYTALKILEKCDSLQKWIIYEFIKQWLRRDYYTRELSSPRGDEGSKTVDYWLNNKIIPLIEPQSEFLAASLRKMISSVSDFIPIQDAYGDETGKSVVKKLSKAASIATSSVASVESEEGEIVPINIEEKGAYKLCAAALNKATIALMKKLKIPELMKSMTEAPTVYSLIQHFNQVAAFVTYSVLRGSTVLDVDDDLEADVRHRNIKTSREVMKFFAQVAFRCIKEKNFDTAEAIFYGLNHFTISRLHESPPDNYTELAKVFSDDLNYKVLRKKIAKTKTDRFHIFPLHLYTKDFVNITSNQLKVDGEYNVHCLVRESHMIEQYINMKQICESVPTQDETSISLMVGKLADYQGKLDDLFKAMADTYPKKINVLRKVN
jgi:hypothetical protein